MFYRQETLVLYFSPNSFISMSSTTTLNMTYFISCRSTRVEQRKGSHQNATGVQSECDVSPGEHTSCWRARVTWSHPPTGCRRRDLLVHEQETESALASRSQEVERAATRHHCQSIWTFLNMMTPTEWCFLSPSGGWKPPRQVEPGVGMFRRENIFPIIHISADIYCRCRYQTITAKKC